MEGSPRPPREYAESGVSDKGLDYVLPKRKLVLGDDVRVLSPFVEDFAFFCIAPLYLWGSFWDLVLWDYQNLRGGPVEFFHKMFRRPIFRGLDAANGDTAWNYVLWAVRREDWSSFVDHICAVVLTDTPGRVVYRFGVSDLKIVDPVFVDRQLLSPDGIPRLDISVFGVRSSRYTAAITYATHPLLSPPELRFFPPDPQCKMYAEALFQADPQVAMSVMDDQTMKENLRADPP